MEGTASVPAAGVTMPMLKAGDKASDTWRNQGQSGHEVAAVYFAMRRAAGFSEDDVQEMQIGFTEKHLAAGNGAVAEFEKNSGTRSEMIYDAILAAYQG